MDVTWWWLRLGDRNPGSEDLMGLPSFPSAEKEPLGQSLWISLASQLLCCGQKAEGEGGPQARPGGTWTGLE